MDTIQQSSDAAAVPCVTDATDSCYDCSSDAALKYQCFSDRDAMIHALESATCSHSLVCSTLLFGSFLLVADFLFDTHCVWTGKTHAVRAYYKWVLTPKVIYPAPWPGYIGLVFIILPMLTYCLDRQVSSSMSVLFVLITSRTPTYHILTQHAGACVQVYLLLASVQQVRAAARELGMLLFMETLTIDSFFLLR